MVPEDLQLLTFTSYVTPPWSVGWTERWDMTSDVKLQKYSSFHPALSCFHSPALQTETSCCAVNCSVASGYSV